MSHRIVRVDADETVQQAADRMRRYDIGFLAVVGDGRLVGVITDRDVATRAVAHGRPPTTRVREVMTPEAVTCFADEDVADVAGLMAAQAIRRVVVVDRELAEIGLLSVDDLAVQGLSELAAGVLARVVTRQQMELDGELV